MFNNNSNKSLASKKDQTPWSNWQNEVSSLFDRFNRDFSLSSSEGIESFPKIEIIEDDKKLCICAEVPGMSEKDVNVTLKDNHLIIDGERKSERKSEKDGSFQTEFSYGSFHRSIPIGDDLKEDTIKATYKDGLLRVEIQKTHPTQSGTSKKIPVVRS